MYEELKDSLGSIILLHHIDSDGGIKIENDTYGVTMYLNVKQTKQLIEFLTEQIKDK
jgi:hypothetical protein